MRKVLLAACLLACGVFASAASAEVVVRVSKGRQAMYVYVDGQLAYTWPVSTAAWGYNTPDGVYYPTALDAYHRSGRYGSPMPYSIFFTGGYAIHGSYDIRNLGYPASHGCIRLHPQNAGELYDLVRSSNRTRIVVGW
ncbi:MAG TPA: L,D-transpeptidase [Geobacterales bacterium]|nr:L,D-transpeptidase [Geobacterales bacterium]